jgi:hypothetical protein
MVDVWRWSDVIAKHRFAQEVGKTLRAINKMIARGDLPPVDFHIGKTGFWNRRKLEAYLLERERQRLGR